MNNLRRAFAAVCAAACATLAFSSSAVAAPAPATQWEKSDFVIEQDGEETVVRGLSEAGLEKVRTNKDVVIPEGITVLTGNKRNGNDTGNLHGKKLTSITLPSTLKEIGYGFLDRNNISSLNLPEGMEVVAPGAVQNNSLTEVIFPTTLKELGSAAFGVNNISTVTFKGKYDDVNVRVVAGSNTGNGKAPFHQQELAPVTIAANGVKQIIKLQDVDGDLTGRKLTWISYVMDAGSQEPARESQYVSFKDGVITGVKAGATRLIAIANEIGTNKPIYSAVVDITVTEPTPDPAPAPTPDPTSDPTQEPAKVVASKAPAKKLANTGASAQVGIAAMGLLVSAGYLALRRSQKLS